MKKTIALVLVVLLSFASAAFAETSFDLSDLTFDELVALKDQINLAMWNSKEWQEVTVPDGLWKIGEDIPAGHWTITVFPSSWVDVKYGNRLNENGKEVSLWNSDFYYSEILCGEKHVFSKDDDLRFIDIDAKEGFYIEIDGGSVVFTPYSGKPSLGFK